MGFFLKWGVLYMTHEYATVRKILQLSNSITNYRNRRMQEKELTSTQFDAIRYILKNHDNKEITAADVMGYLKLSQSTVAGILSRLEEKELIIRKPHETDARKSIIMPTEKGLKLEEYLKKTAMEMENILMQNMTEKEQVEFNRLLQMALDNINSAKL